MAFMMIGVRSSKDPRSGIQNGFWAIKLIVLIGCIVGAFFIPKSDSFIQGKYSLKVNYFNNGNSKRLFFHFFLLVCFHSY